MNKKITLYELLGLIKDGQAPKRIKQIFNDGFKEEYILDKEGWYETTDKTTKMNIFKADKLNSIVEILEEEKKIEKITLLNNGNPNSYAIYDENGTKCALTKHSKVMVDKINEIIDEINSHLSK